MSPERPRNPCVVSPFHIRVTRCSHNWTSCWVDSTVHRTYNTCRGADEHAKRGGWPALAGVSRTLCHDGEAAHRVCTVVQFSCAHAQGSEGNHWPSSLRMCARQEIPNRRLPCARAQGTSTSSSFPCARAQGNEDDVLVPCARAQGSLLFGISCLAHMRREDGQWLPSLPCACAQENCTTVHTR